MMRNKKCGENNIVFKRIGLFIILLIFMFFSSIVPLQGADPLDTWHWRNPVPPYVNYYGVEYGNSTVVAVGFYGIIISSSDGANWSVQKSGNREFLTDIAYGESLFVVVGHNSTILTSPDGINWTPRDAATVHSLYRVTYKNSLFVAVGENGTILTSPDGINWTPRDSGTTAHLNGVTASDSMFVAAGETGTVLTSGDGIAWTQRSSGTANSIKGVTYGNSRFVFLSGYYNSYEIFTSEDGVNWSRSLSINGREFNNVVFANSQFYMLGQSGMIYDSPDGLSWSWYTDGGMPSLNDMIYDGTQYITACSWGGIYYKPSGGSWTSANYGVRSYLHDITYGNSLFIAVGEYGSIASSPDGVTWTTRVYAGNAVYSGAAYGNNKFVVVGSNGKVTTSLNGEDWSPQFSISDYYLNSVAFGNGMFTAVGQGGVIYTSPDGVSWTKRDSGTAKVLNDVTYGNGMFLVTGDNDAVLTSPDGAVWTSHAADSDWGMADVAIGDSMYIAVGGPGTIYTSTDAVNWTKQWLPTDEWLYGVGYGNSTFVVTGNNGSIFTSHDGINWSLKNSGTYHSLNAVCFANNRFLIGGGYGTIVQSDQFLAVSGTVTRNGLPVNGIPVTFSHDNNQVATTAEGKYIYRVPYGVSATVTPAKNQYAFTPSQYSYSNLTANKENQDFTALYLPEDTVAITSPAEGGQVSGTVAITVSQLNMGVTIEKVVFFVDGTKIGEDTASPFEFQWDTTTATENFHTISVEAVDSSNQLYQDQVTVQVKNLEFPPIVGLSRQRLNFSAVIGGEQTGPQTFLVLNHGDGTLSWETIPSSPWVRVSPASGFGEGMVTVTVNPDGLSPGDYFSEIVVKEATSSRVPLTVFVYLTVKKASQDEPPFGVFDTPADGSTVRSSIPVTGWALDDMEVSSVKIYRDPVAGEPAGRVWIGDAVLVEGARPDVADAYPEYPGYYKAGWGYMMLTNGLPNQGNGAYTIIAAATDTAGQETILGRNTITCDNANAVKPFGALDTPLQGGTASGSEFKNWGWALTPQPNTIPFDGSTISLWIDGKKVPGPPVYNLNRKDIAAIFPGYNNSQGAGGYFAIDTTQYDNGVHSISWTVTDDAGNTDGIGSRFFSILNTGVGNRSGSHAKRETPPAVRQRPVDTVRSVEPVRMLNGFDNRAKATAVYPGDDGVVTVNMMQNSRLEIHLDGSGKSYGIFYGKDGNDRLPPGSTFDRVNGIFYWAPGPGVFGTYDFDAIEYLPDGSAGLKKLRVVVQPVIFDIR